MKRNIETDREISLRYCILISIFAFYYALARAHSKTPMVLLAMGEMGFPTRVLSAALGGLYTYAAPNAGEGTASGQVSAKQLRHLYRAEKFTRDAHIYGVIADPVWHSISPAVQNRAFQARRIECP